MGSRLKMVQIKFYFIKPVRSVCWNFGEDETSLGLIRTGFFMKNNSLVYNLSDHKYF
jgi:hypothetical protein